MPIYNENCLDRMKSISDNSIDCIVTDPPYKVTARGCSGSMGGYWKNEKANKGKIFEFNDISCKEYLPEFFRILKDKSFCYVMTNNLNLQEMINEGTKAGFKFVKTLIWDKQNKICGRYYMNCFEYIILFRKGGDRQINNCSTPDILSIPIKKLKDENGNNLHDTEKPVELMKILIDNSTNKGDVVFEPFMGIGATCIACLELDRDYIGTEIDKKYFEIAKKRIEQAEKDKNPELFELGW